MTGSRRSFGWLLAVLAVLWVGVGCEGRERPTPRNLLVITIDTTRADHLGAYRYAVARTPSIDALAADGTTFDRAYATTPETLPSHCSLFTGLYPPAHGVRLNLSFRLPEEATTLAEVFRESGFFTGAVTASAILDRQYGLDQGFEAYSDPGSEDLRERRAEAVTSEALDVLDGAGERPFFLWVHYYDPHSPFDPPEPFDAPGDVPLESAELYDREIAYMDHWIGRLFDGLRRRGSMDGTLVVLAGDHGESLGDHGETYHTLFLYDSTIRVPLVVAGPGIVAGRRVDDVVSLTDIFPTIVELFRLEGRPLDRLAGRALLPGLGLESAGGVRSRVAYSESMTPSLRYGWGDLQALRTEEWVYVQAPREELYDAERDPDQRRNLAGTMPTEVALLRRRLDRTLEELSVSGLAAAAGRQPSREEIRAVEALGYVGGREPGSSEPATSDQDPKDMVEVAESIQLGRLAVRLERYETAEELFRWAASADQSNSEVRRLLGRVYFVRGSYEDALLVLEEAADIAPDSWEVLTDLAAVEERLGHRASARAHVDRALRTSPLPAAVWRRLGRYRLQAGDRAAAARAYEKLLELQPDDARARRVLEALGAGEPGPASPRDSKGP